MNGWTFSVYFPPQAPREQVEAITNQMTALAYDMERGYWDPFAVLHTGDLLNIDGDDT